MLNQLALISIISLAIGCGTAGGYTKMDLKFQPRPGEVVQVGEVSNATGNTYDVPVEEFVANAMSTELRDRDLLWTDAAKSSRLVVKTQILDYEKGNAFKRWLVPGWGATALSVQCELIDAESGALAGTVQATRTISSGGFYTVRAWKTISTDVAKDIAKKIQQELR